MPKPYFFHEGTYELYAMQHFREVEIHGQLCLLALIAQRSHLIQFHTQRKDR